MVTEEMIEAATLAVFNDFHKNDDKKYKPKWENVKDKYRLFYTSLARSALEAAEAVRPSGWQPIDTAPRGERIMVYYKHFEGSVLSPYLVGIIFDDDGEIYLDCDNGEITIDELDSREGLYWQILLEPPNI